MVIFFKDNENHDILQLESSIKILWFDYWVFSKLFSEINSLIAQRRHLLFSMDEISHNYVREECHLQFTKGADSQWKKEWITSNDINFKPCIVKQLLYCRSNVDLGQGRRQDFLWEGKLAFSRPKSEQAKKKLHTSAFYSCVSQRNSSFHLSSRCSAPPLFWSSPVIESVEEAKRGVECLKEGVTDAFLLVFLWEFHYENVSLTQ